MKNLKIAFSSCPNDTFMFHALVHGLVDTEGLSFDATHTDSSVETLKTTVAKTAVGRPVAEVFDLATDTREGLLTVIKNDFLWNFPTNHQIGFQR